ncbi:MAG: NERD domain-containing protein [Pseudomonadota bacterium]|nr:NERD domain-containing protein [Pseudomonadota bacterium]
MSLIKGWLGERVTGFRLWLGLDETVYHRFNDLYIPVSNETAQIDHLLVSRFGVFIVETKHMKGWIYGSENQAKWTQVLYRKKYSFQNPLRQTFRQKKALAAKLSLDEANIHPVMVFFGECKFKTEMPKNVIKLGLSRYIETFTDPVFSQVETALLASKVEQLQARNRTTREEHVEALNKRHRQTDICPRCQQTLIQRQVKTGARKGQLFWGCSAFPRCRFTQSIE